MGLANFLRVVNAGHLRCTRCSCDIRVDYGFEYVGQRLCVTLDDRVMGLDELCFACWFRWEREIPRVHVIRIGVEFPLWVDGALPVVG